MVYSLNWSSRFTIRCPISGECSLVEIELSQTEVTMDTYSKTEFIISCNYNGTFHDAADSLMSLSLKQYRCGRETTLATMTSLGEFELPIRASLPCRSTVENYYDPSNQGAAQLSLTLPASRIEIEDDGNYTCSLEYSVNGSSVEVAVTDPSHVTVRKFIFESLLCVSLWHHSHFVITCT